MYPKNNEVLYRKDFICLNFKNRFDACNKPTWTIRSIRTNQDP